VSGRNAPRTGRRSRASAPLARPGTDHATEIGVRSGTGRRQHDFPEDVVARTRRASRNNGRVDSWVLHVDLDQFVAAVEVLRRPELRGRPVVVGGSGDPTHRGVVSTASYEARAAGVHSGQPLRTARRRCPDAVFLPVDRDAYDAASAAVMAALRGCDAVVEVMGWDEAFLGVRTTDPYTFARDVQQRVRVATDLDCTVGIGQNKLQAKMATGYGKPAGVFTITDANWFELLGDRPTIALWGIGDATGRRLFQIGIRSVAHLAAADPEQLAGHVGANLGPWLIELANGRFPSPVSGAPRVARSRSREMTFQVDLVDWDDVRDRIGQMARELTVEAEDDGRVVGQVVVKIRLVPYTTLTRSRSLGTPTTDPALVEAAAWTALDRIERRRAVRLLGVQVVFAPAAAR
jgi:DNA polymerase IV